MILFFDTETNGLPRNYKAPATDVDNWPRITQIAISVRHDDGQVYYENQWLIKPNGWTIPTVKELTASGSKDPEFFERNNMSTERCEREGVDVYEALHAIVFSMNECHTVAAHNLAFDWSVLIAELIRNDVLSGVTDIEKIERVCTMNLSTDILQIPGLYGFKWPSLTELVAWLGGTMEGAHDAMNDARACADAYFELKRRGLLTPAPKTNITYSNIFQYKNMPAKEYFKLGGVSHSWLKREKNGVVEKFEPTEKMLVGTLVDQFLTEPDKVDVNNPHYAKARKIAICIKNTFGDLIARFQPQLCYTATMHYGGLKMDTTGRLDWLLPRHAVIDLKFTTAKKIEPVIEHFGYKNQLWNYAKMAQVPRAYILAYSDAIEDCLPIVQVDVSSDYNEFWAQGILKHGSV